MNAAQQQLTNANQQAAAARRALTTAQNDAR